MKQRRRLLRLLLAAACAAPAAAEAPNTGGATVADLIHDTAVQGTTANGAGQQLISLHAAEALGGAFLVAGCLVAWLKAAKVCPKLKSAGMVGVSISQVFFVLTTCSAFMLIGPALMILNKHIMQHHGFPYPLSLSGLGVLSSSIFSYATVKCGFVKVRHESLQAVAGQKWLRTALPVGACKACTLATGNAAYLYLGLGFIQMLKAFTPAVVLVVMCILGSNRPCRPAIWCVMLIVAGTVLEVKGELHLTALGLALMMVSEVVEAINLVMTQQLLQDCKYTVMEGLYVLAPPSTMCLFAVAAVWEWPAMVRHDHLSVIAENPLDFAAAGALGLAVNFVTMMLVQATSSLFTKILNTVRCICLVYIGVLFYGEQCSTLELVGYGIALLGFAGYNYVQLFPQEAARMEHAVDSCLTLCSGRLEKQDQKSKIDTDCI